jgi:hypothetical protein
MADNFRGENSSLFDDEDFELPAGENSPVVKQSSKRKSQLLGMTPMQRFIIAVMIMIAVCILGAACLTITGKIGLML